MIDYEVITDSGLIQCFCENDGLHIRINGRLDVVIEENVLVKALDKVRRTNVDHTIKNIDDALNKIKLEDMNEYF